MSIQSTVKLTGKEDAPTRQLNKPHGLVAAFAVSIPTNSSALREGVTEFLCRRVQRHEIAQLCEHVGGSFRRRVDLDTPRTKYRAGLSAVPAAWMTAVPQLGAGLIAWWPVARLSALFVAFVVLTAPFTIHPACVSALGARVCVPPLAIVACTVRARFRADVGAGWALL